MVRLQNLYLLAAFDCGARLDLEQVLVRSLAYLLVLLYLGSHRIQLGRVGDLVAEGLA